ncbi:uncharacterized protein VTP21DRAFT_4498 [Calcarisporiella thermophila]|uniref:uncharacterized protein n=1 Tax=Calcarisporiella thermophila TaxID=911321 RepID=UPI003742B68C
MTARRRSSRLSSKSTAGCVESTETDQLENGSTRSGSSKNSSSSRNSKGKERQQTTANEDESEFDSLDDFQTSPKRKSPSTRKAVTRSQKRARTTKKKADSDDSSEWVPEKSDEDVEDEGSESDLPEQTPVISSRTRSKRLSTTLSLNEFTSARTILESESSSITTSESSIGLSTSLSSLVTTPATTVTGTTDFAESLSAGEEVFEAVSEEDSDSTGRQRRRRRQSGRRSRGRQGREEDETDHYTRVGKKLMSHHKELTDVWGDLDKRNRPIPVDNEVQPDGLTAINLLPFQREGLSWLQKQEESEFAGGILADEMGMGKTIQMISLLVSEPRKKPNLIVAPAVAILQWKNEINKFSNLNVCVWHGSQRIMDPRELKQFDVVLTTYSIVESMFRKEMYGFRRKEGMVKEDSLLHKLFWHRIVLDEAHNIKDRSCNTARAVFALESTYKWCLTGTPLQNRIGELFSLLRFMKIDPFAYYFCKQCPCKMLHWRFENGQCIGCGHRNMSHVCYWNNEILKPIQAFGAVGVGEQAYLKLRKLLDHIMLRRTKVERADDLGLPPRIVVVRKDRFTEEEEDIYDSLYSDTKRKFTTYVDQGTLLNNYANIFQLLTRMRLMSDHPCLVLNRETPASGHNTLVCNICFEVAEDPILSRCRCLFCRQCVEMYVNGFVGNEPECPGCHKLLIIDFSQPTYELPTTEVSKSERARLSIVNRINMEQWRSSTKIEALLEELTLLRDSDQTIKSIVFSQFVNFLDLIHWRLRRAGFKCVKLDGGMSPQQRDAVIRHFMTDPETTVFLVSLKAGGVALNLTEASQVFMMDPWWNPAAEYQAYDRVHRLGQHRPIKITRFMIENSLESRIIELQEKKLAMMESTIGKDDKALARLSEEDMRFLFSL